MAKDKAGNPEAGQAPIRWRKVLPSTTPQPPMPTCRSS